MTAPSINHITLNTSHINRSSRADVCDASLDTLRPWLAAAILSGKPEHLPGALAHYRASAMLDGGALVVTVYAAERAGVSRVKPMPLCVVSVAQDRQPSLWGLLNDLHGQRGAPEPEAPWCAVALLPTLADDMQAARWLGDFERCIAWAWITDSPLLRAAT